MKKLIVLGPNGVEGASFHVHAAGCSDLGKAKYSRVMREERGCEWFVSPASEQELVEIIYSDFIGSGETFGSYRPGEHSVWQDYACEVKIFPCCELEKSE